MVSGSVTTICSLSIIPTSPVLWGIGNTLAISNVSSKSLKESFAPSHIRSCPLGINLHPDVSGSLSSSRDLVHICFKPNWYKTALRRSVRQLCTAWHTRHIHSWHTLQKCSACVSLGLYASRQTSQGGGSTGLEGPHPIILKNVQGKMQILVNSIINITTITRTKPQVNCIGSPSNGCRMSGNQYQIS